MQLLAVLLAFVVSAQGASIVSIGNPATPTAGISISKVTYSVIDGAWCSDHAVLGSKLVITFVGATGGPIDGSEPVYGLKCSSSDPGEPNGDCPGFELPTINLLLNGGGLELTYQTQAFQGLYQFDICVGDATCQTSSGSIQIEVRRGACQFSDPIIIGFDGKSFHFDDVGEYVMLESGDGYQVHSTFAGATAHDGAEQTTEKSWASSVRLISPNGDMVSCALPAIVPNTSRIQVTAAAVGGSVVDLLSVTRPSADLAEMSASVVLSEGEEPRQVTGCMLTTPKLVIRVDQVSGYRQAQLHPDTESWAAPFTWLDTSFKVTKPLAGPVTGIIGATYPADMVVGQSLLHSAGEVTDETASMKGEEPAFKTHRRSLSSVPSKFMPITSSVVGLDPAGLSL